MFSNDVLYLFEYNASNRRYERKLLGEVDLSNNGFNNSFVVDGTKDSAKYTFYSYNYRIVKPNSIVWHENTNTWWVVNKDTSQRLMGEHLSQVPHEVEEDEEDTINYLYAHTISLVGAFELLNSRDLTDHGYNSNVYNVGQVFDRLLRMSTFEINTSVVYGDENKNNIAPSTKVDYIKTFENYTLASALREFLDGYNSTAKLTFNVGTSRKLPNGYTELNYIESTGTQVINTGIVPNNLTSVAVKFEIADTTTGMIFGAQNFVLSPLSIYGFQFGWEYDYIDNVLAFNGVYGTNLYNGEQALTDNSYNVVSATLGNFHFISISAQIKATYDSTTSFSVGIPMAVFGNYSNDLLHVDTYSYNKLAKAKLYAMQIYQDNTMVADYIPCKRNSDNELGLYDLVTNTFLTNQGTGTFVAGQEVPIVDYITSANLIIIPKSGDITKPVLDISYFDDVREISTNNKTSSGEIVVSNAQNVVSTQPKTFPTSGGVKLTGNQFEFSAMDAILRLPSAVHKVNWVKIFNKNVIAVSYTYQGVPTRQFFTIDPFNVEAAFENMKTWINAQYGSSMSSQVEEDKNEIIDIMKKACTTTLYGGVNIYPDSNNKQQFVAPKDNPNFYFPIVHKSGATSAFDTERELVLADKELGDNMETTDGQGNCDRYIGWERGKDYLYNFKFLEPQSAMRFPYFKDFESTDLRTNGWAKQYYDNGVFQFAIGFYNVPSSHLMEIKDLYFQVNYIPMSDLKVKVDNDNLGDNTKLYNQSGKLTDSVAFSKLINSYSKEIANETITRYKTFINPSEIPSVGQLVDYNGVQFVISNISLDYTLNESGVFGGNYNYYVVGEFTMSRYVATKSALTNPNTNIRDYQIPQNYNVKRKQLYRDYYELDYTEDELRDNEMYLPLSKVFNVSNAYVGFQEHTALIECEYNENIGGNDNNTSKHWYYKLETTTYILKKEIYEVIDFKDNNIIGYSSQNIYGGFAITEIFTPNKNINTPITYVDNNGQVKGITILMSTYEQLDNASVNYLTAIGSQNVDKSYMLNNYPVFIPQALYDVALYNGYYDFVIEETEYEKDAIEVPFFEYSCQINDSSNVIIGNNIFDTTEDDIFYFFMYKLVDKGVFSNDTIESELELTAQDLYATQGYSNSGKQMGATYDENETYYVGDIVRYPTNTSTRYVCLEDSVTGTWDSSKWEETHTIINQTNAGNNNFFQGFNSVKLSFKDVNTLVIENFQEQRRTYLTNEVVFGTHTDFVKNSIKDYDMLIYRLTMKNGAKLTRTSDDRGFFSVKNDAIMILRNTENCVINENGEIEIKVNHFKVK